LDNGTDMPVVVRRALELDPTQTLPRLYHSWLMVLQGDSAGAIGLVSIVVRDYDEALAFYVGKLGFSLIEDTYQPAQDKRWVVVSPPGATESALLLARASTEHQATRVGDQTGGRVFLFLYTDDFGRDFNAYKSKGVKVIREPKTEDYGTVAVFHDLHGNQWDLIQPSAGKTVE
jgi:catechol 2,3-dioxygenase-like lactoylglutathione lyase family enzyme